jgi:hypothetical protein
MTLQMRDGDEWVEMPARWYNVEGHGRQNLTWLESHWSPEIVVRPHPPAGHSPYEIRRVDQEQPDEQDPTDDQGPPDSDPAERIIVRKLGRVVGVFRRPE